MSNCTAMKTFHLMNILDFICGYNPKNHYCNPSKCELNWLADCFHSHGAGIAASTKKQLSQMNISVWWHKTNFFLSKFVKAYPFKNHTWPETSLYFKMLGLQIFSSTFRIDCGSVQYNRGHLNQRSHKGKVSAQPTIRPLHTLSCLSLRRCSFQVCCCCWHLFNHTH